MLSRYVSISHCYMSKASWPTKHNGSIITVNYHTLLNNVSGILMTYSQCRMVLVMLHILIHCPHHSPSRFGRRAIYLRNKEIVLSRNYNKSLLQFYKMVGFLLLKVIMLKGRIQNYIDAPTKQMFQQDTADCVNGFPNTQYDSSVPLSQ